MKEIDLVQAVAAWINLSYVAGQWWITITTALLIATYFAARHIPSWLFAVIVLLYILTVLSVVSEYAQYAGQAKIYAVRLAEFRAANHLPSQVEPYWNFSTINTWNIYAVFILGSFSAAIYSFALWRNARKG